MSDVDDVLLRLRDAPVPAGLSLLEDRVLEALAARNEAARTFSARPMAMAAVGALTIGMLGALPGNRAEPAATSFPLGEVPSLAPSTLLAGN